MVLKRESYAAFFAYNSNFHTFFCIDAISHPVEAILHQQMMKTLDENFEAKKASIEDTYSPIKDLFSHLLSEIIKTKSGKLLVSSILKELKRPSTPKEAALARDNVKIMTVSGESRWAYSSSKNLLKIPTKFDDTLQFAVIKGDRVGLEKIDPRVALFHELLHWYHDLADKEGYFGSAVPLTGNEEQNLMSVWSHTLFPPFMSALQNDAVKKTIFESLVEGDLVSLEEVSTIFGNGVFDITRHKSALSENMFRLELGLGSRILYADIPDSNEERKGWILIINNQVDQANSKLKSAQATHSSPMPSKGNLELITAKREEALRKAMAEHTELYNLIRDMQMLCDIRTTGAMLIDRQIAENLK